MGNFQCRKLLNYQRVARLMETISFYGSLLLLISPSVVKKSESNTLNPQTVGFSNAFPTVGDHTLWS